MLTFPAMAMGDDCRRKALCWGEKNLAKASVYCASSIVKLAKYDHKWTDSWYKHKFYMMAWKDQKAGIITYGGDRLKFQNGFGAYQNYMYKCDYDTARELVVDVQIAPGKF